MTAPPLAGLDVSELKFLRKAIDKGQLPAPVSRLALHSVNRGKLFDKLGPLREASRAAALALLDLALLARETVAPGNAPGGSTTLVWSGPMPQLSSARPTTAIVLELFEKAQHDVLIAGYQFDHGKKIFEPLHRAMTQRNVRALVYFDVPSAQTKKTHVQAHLIHHAQAFFTKNWPFGAPYPDLFYFPAGAAYKGHRSIHAKCVVVDRRHVLVGSANFTRCGHDDNVEVGVCLEDDKLGEALWRQFEGLLLQGQFAAVHPIMAAKVSPPLAAEDESEELPAGSPPVSNDFGALADELFVSDEARPLFLRLLQAGFVEPEVGFDIQGERGEVLATAELAWPSHRVAALLGEQRGGLHRLRTAGWTCFVATPAEEEFAVLCEHLSREP